MLNGYDFSVHSDEYRIYLQRPDRTTILELVSAYGINISENYGGLDQLTFKIPNRTKKGVKYIRNIDVDLTRGDYLVKLERGTEVKYFIIANIKSSYNQGNEILEIEANFQPYELSYKIVHAYKQIKPLYDFVGTNSILHDTLLALSDYTVGYCNVSVGNQYRSIDVSQTDLLSFLNQMANTFNVIVSFDTINKTVSFKTESEDQIDYGVYIDDSNLKSIVTSEQYKEIITRLYCYGKDIDISSVTLTGSPFIEDFSFYIYPYTEDGSGNVLTHSNYLSDGLCHALLAYQTLLQNNSTTFSTYLTNRANLVTSLIPYQLLDTTYKIDMDAIDANIDINIKNDLSLATLNAQKVAKQAQIDANQATMDGINANIATIDGQIVTLQTTLSESSNFTSPQIAEKNKFTREKPWTDTRYINANDLLADGIVELGHISSPTTAFEIDMADIITQINDSKDWNKVKIGSIVTIRFPDFNTFIKAKIINLTHSLDDNSLKVTIANRRDIQSGILKFADLLNKSITTSSNVDFKSGDWDQGKVANNTVTNYIKNAIDAATQQINSGNNNCVVIDNRGITITDNDLSILKKIKLTNGVIAISNDGLNYRTAITGDKVVADVLAGNLVISNNLLVSNTATTVSINGSGMTVAGGSLTITGGLPDAQIGSSTTWNTAATDAANSVQLSTSYNNVIISAASGINVIDSLVKSKTIMDSNGFKVQKNTGTPSVPVWTNQISLDSNGNAIFSGTVSIGSGSSIFKADSNGIYLGNSSFASAPFRVDLNGNAVVNSIQINSPTITNGTITGANLIIGSGNSIFKADTNGLYLGNAVFASAPFKVSPSGVLTATGVNLSGNFTMTSGSISWANISSDPTIATAQSTANSASSTASSAQSTANSASSTANSALTTAQQIAAGTYPSGTFIDGTTIYSPNISAGILTGTTIKTSANYPRLEMSGNNFVQYGSSAQTYLKMSADYGFGQIEFTDNTTGLLSAIYANDGFKLNSNGNQMQINAAYSDPAFYDLEINADSINFVTSLIDFGFASIMDHPFTISNVYNLQSSLDAKVEKTSNAFVKTGATQTQNLELQWYSGHFEVYVDGAHVGDLTPV